MNNYGYYQSEIGLIKIGYEDNCITYINIVSKIDTSNRTSNISDHAYKELNEYFNGTRKQFTFPYCINGTEFQKKVYKELIKIPYGETRSYQDIAIAIGNKKATRAVGMANNRNNIIIVIPCHRVIGKNKQLVGYGCGLDIKEKLLELEKRNR